MQPGPDYAGDKFPITKSETGPAGPEQVAREMKPGAKPFTGGYYWLPNPTLGGITWSVVTCRDLGCGRDAGHDAELWPRLMAPFARVWDKDATVLKKKLALYFTALPRGRVTRPGKTFLVLHGNNSPDVPAGWEGLVIEAFGLSGRKVKTLFDEHETMIAGHRQAIEKLLGSTFYEAEAEPGE